MSELNVASRSPFDLRLFHTGAYHGDTAFPLRLRHNGFIIGFDSGDHTILKLLPPKEHFLAHPDWYMYTPEDDENTGEYGYPQLFARMTESGPRQWVDLAVKPPRLPYEVCLSSAGALEAVTVAVWR